MDTAKFNVSNALEVSLGVRAVSPRVLPDHIGNIPLFLVLPPDLFLLVLSPSVKQGKPRTIEAVVGATLECESYLVRPPQRSAVAAVRMEPKDSALMEMMTQLMARMDRLEENSKSVYSKKDTQTTSDTSGMSRFSDRSFEDWIDQFESIAEINHWNDGQKLMWLKVCLTGRALMAYKKFSVTARGSFKNVIKALQERFEPESRKDLYRAEFQTRCKEETEGWPEFGEDLRVLVDRAYPSLEDEARQQLALQRYLSQLDNEQVALLSRKILRNNHRSSTLKFIFWFRHRAL